MNGRADVGGMWSTAGMDDAAVRSRLDELRAQTLSQLAKLGVSRDDVMTAAAGSNVDDEHDPEGATIAFEREMLQALIVQTRAHLAEVDAALERLAAGTYGACEVCGAAIGDGRLAARPTAARCIRHA